MANTYDFWIWAPRPASDSGNTQDGRSVNGVFEVGVPVDPVSGNRVFNAFDTVTCVLTPAPNDNAQLDPFDASANAKISNVSINSSVQLFTEQVNTGPNTWLYVVKFDGNAYPLSFVNQTLSNAKMWGVVNLENPDGFTYFIPNMFVELRGGD